MLVVVVLGGYALASTANAQQAIVSASDIQYAATVRQGSSGQASLIWQKFLNGYSSANLVQDGNFGPLSVAAAKIWQASRNLSVDGVLGAMSRASAIAQINSGVVLPGPGTYPAGCSSNSGYSVTTGQSCAVSTSLPSGCTSTAGYSPTTGAKCDGGSTSSGVLEGGAGSITLTAKSTYSNEEVVAGDEDVPVLAFEIEADEESDVEITSAKVEFYNSNTASSRRLEDYADSVSILMNGDVVGSADAEDFSESSKYYSKTISLDGAIVEAGETEVFSVAVTALSNLDSGDIDTDVWGADLLNVRFEDGEGVVSTETGSAAGADESGSFERDFDFDDLATSGDLELSLSLGSDSPNAQSVEVDAVTTTNVTMLEFTLEAEGSDMTIDALGLTGTAAGVDNTWADMVSSLSLEADGDEIDSISAYGDAVDDTTGELNFTNLDLAIEEGDTINFKVVAKIRAIAAEAGDNTFEQGDTFLVSFPLTDLEDADTDVVDGNGDAVADADLTGSAVGEIQTFYSSGVQVDMGTVTYESVTDSGNVTQVTYNIPLSITSYGDTRYIGLSVEEDNDGDTITDGQAISYAFQDAGAPATDLAEATTTAVESWSCSATIESTTGYRLDEGSEVDCTLSITLSTEDNVPGSYRVHVEGIETWTAAALNAGGVTQQLTPVEDFQTAFKLLNS